MKIAVVRSESSPECVIISVDNDNWYRASELFPDMVSMSTIELLALHNENPDVIADTVSEQQNILEPIELAAYEKVLMAHDDVVIESDDHVILFLVDKQYIHDVEQLFQVDPTFL